ncbi:N-acyl amino acid synthase FeeM domain-containing protein [Paracidovorax sp. MALMAid1276]|uniref:N-acyl amino acid synthase FeeM domain-containing protein n=1 Tax=Paracidovorax sp. MALMAid1276 TaxID=3411631 RepID=UPI003B9D04B6
MRDHGPAPAIQRLVQTLTGRAKRDAPSSTLFMHPDLVPYAPGQGFKIRVARRSSVLQDALGLLNRRYQQRGYGSQTLTLSPERMTIVAYEEQQVIGTLTVQIDTRQGLLSDECFKAPLDVFRARGALLCEFTKLATAPHAPMPATLASMFHVAFIFAHQVNHATHAVVEVNPRHVAFYKRVLGFADQGAKAENPRVKAPGVLLVGDFAQLGRQLRSRGHRGPGEPPPFFSHSFSNAEEQGIRERIRAALAQQGVAP